MFSHIFIGLNEIEALWQTLLANTEPSEHPFFFLIMHGLSATIQLHSLVNLVSTQVEQREPSVPIKDILVKLNVTSEKEHENFFVFYLCM